MVHLNDSTMSSGPPSSPSFLMPASSSSPNESQTKKKGGLKALTSQLVSSKST